MEDKFGFLDMPPLDPEDTRDRLTPFGRVILACACVIIIGWVVLFLLSLGFA